MAGTSYTRQSTLTDGDTITASLFNAEYNQLVLRFHTRLLELQDTNTMVAQEKVETLRYNWRPRFFK